MIVALLLGALCAVIAGTVFRPFLSGGHFATARSSPDTRLPRSALRQLRDLEDDLASGKLDETDYARLRSDLERQAAQELRSAVPAEPSETNAKGPDAAAARTRRAGGLAPSRRTRRSNRVLVVAVAACLAVGVGVLLRGSVDQRLPRAEATGGTDTTAQRAADDSPSPTPSPRNQLTARQVADVQAAATAVKRRPRQASAHVELARAYAAARQPQLATVEYLAATRLDPGNDEANTALALVAFKAGRVHEADALVSKALRETPEYPEALYTRGLIRAMGLHHSAAAKRDLDAYQRVAPHGSHTTTVATVLALLASGAIK